MQIDALIGFVVAINVNRLKCYWLNPAYRAPFAVSVIEKKMLDSYMPLTKYVPLSTYPTSSEIYMHLKTYCLLISKPIYVEVSIITKMAINFIYILLWNIDIHFI